LAEGEGFEGVDLPGSGEEVGGLVTKEILVAVGSQGAGKVVIALNELPAFGQAGGIEAQTEPKAIGV
jgi:hypothetical protein